MIGKSFSTSTKNTAIRNPKAKKKEKIKLFGILGLLSLLIPWSAEFWKDPYLYYEGSSVTWHLFDWVSIGDWGSNLQIIFSDFSEQNSLFSIINVIGFSLILVGSLALITRRGYGGLLLLASIILWVSGYTIDSIGWVYFITIPIGTLLSGIIGVFSLFNEYKRFRKSK